jgi:hypothetical protein
MAKADRCTPSVAPDGGVGGTEVGDFDRLPRPQAATSTGTRGLSRVVTGAEVGGCPSSEMGVKSEGVAVIGGISRSLGTMHAKGALRRSEWCWSRVFRVANQHKPQGKRGRRHPSISLVEVRSASNALNPSSLLQ